jgi:hypothetical protein
MKKVNLTSVLKDESIEEAFSAIANGLRVYNDEPKFAKFYILNYNSLEISPKDVAYKAAEIQNIQRSEIGEKAGCKYYFHGGEDYNY